MLLRTQIELMTLVSRVRAALVERVYRDERGEVTSTTITIAILATLALAVGAIIVAKVTGKAESIPTE